jgi:hypothetical protein
VKNVWHLIEEASIEENHSAGSQHKPEKKERKS